MGLGRNEREEILWDTHETAVAEQPLEITTEVNPKLYGLEEVKAKEITSGLSVTLSEREALIESYKAVIELPITSENLEVFKSLRLKIRDNRTKGIEKWHTANKAFYLAGGRFVDAIKNKEVLVNEQMEEKLSVAEKHFENLEKERLAKINLERREVLRPYVEDVDNMDFTQMNDYDFDDFVLGKKTRFEANLEAERIAEENRLKEIEAENERKRLEEIEIERVRQENEVLKKEAEEKELALQKEREENERKSREALERQEAELKAEREKQAKIEDELQAKKDAEAKAEAERLAEIERQKKEADKLAKAPIKKQLSLWVDGFTISEINVDNDKKKLILEKFEAFKKWAKSEIETI